MDVADAPLRGEELVRGHDLTEAVERVMHALGIQDVDLLLRLRVTELQPDEEPVELGLGSGKVPSYSIGFCVAMTRNGSGSW